MPKLSVNRFVPRAPVTLVLGAALATVGAVAWPAVASASSSQIAMIQDDSDLYNPSGTLGQFRALGATTVRVFVPWSLVAPNRTSQKKPSFDATNPGAYPAANWVPFDNLVRQAKLDGLGVDLTVAGAPRWAEGSGIPAVATTNPYYAWKPNAGEYGQFMQAIGKRYSGSFTPRSQSSSLPAVRFWSIFNEPNFGQDLGPQAIRGSSVSVAPMMYRSLVDAGWTALQSTGHGHDTILVGEYAARGIGPGRPTRNAPQGYPGNFGQTKPLQFIRTLYCVDRGYHELRGALARAVGCPTSAAGSRSFRRQHPGLFNATGVADHPYPDNLSPVADGRTDPDFAALPDLGNLARTLDQVNRVYGSRQRYPIYNTEYGYITHPPKSSHYPSPSTAAYYINWAEYLSFKNPRVASYMQYLLADPSPNTGAYNGFASGLETYKGTKKATYYAYRMPFYMPRTSFSHHQSVEVWGAARPAPLAALDGNGTQQVQIQLQTGHGGFKTLSTVTLNRPGGYFDVRMRFPSSGTVRLQWTYPSQESLVPSEDLGQPIYSRTFNISVH